MGKGFLKVELHTADGAMPVANAEVEINSTDGENLYKTTTDENGSTGVFELTAPNAELTLDENYNRPAYSVCDVIARKIGYVTMFIHGVEIVDTQTTILPVDMMPLEESGGETETHIYLGPPGILLRMPYLKDEQIEPRATVQQSIKIQQVNPLGIVIPDYITVHLGVPTNAAARNVRVKFTDYIKNVVSSEIYSTWPRNSLLANIHAIVTFALNRVFTEWYPSRNFNFDITNSTAYDQHYRHGGPVFDNVSKLVDEYFNTYARRIGFGNPFFTQFCNGSTVTCPGLSQWGTVTLANQGLSPLQILRYYYPDDLELVSSNNITGIVASYPGTALRVGSRGEDVRRMQNFLNRIRVNYPLIPSISNPNGVFDAETENAVKVFQRTFNLTADGIIGRSTWNKINFIHVGVVKLAELDSEGIRVTIGEKPPNVVLRQGSRGEDVNQLQFILNTVAEYFDTVPTVVKDSVFGPSVRNAVMEFQRTFNLTPDGVVGPTTWAKLYSVYKGIKENAPVPPAPPPTTPPAGAIPFPGTPLKVGSRGDDVKLMQTYLNTIRIVYTSIPYLVVDGVFGEATRRSVVAFQQEFILTPDGIIGPITWDKIVEMYLLVTGGATISLEYPGTPLRTGSTGQAVRLMQKYLSDLRAAYPSLPAVAIDGVFGPQTHNAVVAFQNMFRLVPDGIIGPITWNEIIRQHDAIIG